jgi:hypothetical protein
MYIEGGSVKKLAASNFGLRFHPETKDIIIYPSIMDDNLGFEGSLKPHKVVIKNLTLTKMFFYPKMLAKTISLNRQNRKTNKTSLIVFLAFCVLCVFATFVGGFRTAFGNAEVT